MKLARVMRLVLRCALIGSFGLRMLPAWAQTCALSCAQSCGRVLAANRKSDAPRGPLLNRVGRPYQLLFLQFAPESPDVLPRGRSRTTAELDIINTLEIPSTLKGNAVYEDNEVQRLVFGWRRGLNGGTEIGVFVPILWRNGGVLDDLIRAWHRLLGPHSNEKEHPAGTDRYPRYQSILFLGGLNGEPGLFHGNAFGPGDVSLTLKRALWRATPRSALALRFGLKLPTGNPGLVLGSGNADAGIMLDGRYDVGRDVVLYGGFGGILAGHASRVPRSQSRIREFMWAVEYRANRRDSFLWQVDRDGLAVRTGNTVADGAPVTFSFGYERALDRHTILEGAITENGDVHKYHYPWLSNIGPDFSLSFGLEWVP